HRASSRRHAALVSFPPRRSADLDSWLDKSEAERHEAMAQFGLSVNLPKMKADLERYGITYDEWFRESTLHESGYVRDTVDELTRSEEHTSELQSRLDLVCRLLLQ